MSDEPSALQAEGPERSHSLAAFVARYTAALPTAIGDALSEDVTGTSAHFGVDLSAGVHLAIRRALLPGEEVVLPAIIAYQLPTYVRELLAAVPDPGRKLRAADAEMVRAAALVAESKSIAWKAKTGAATHEALYQALNRLLTTVATAAKSVRRLAELEEVGVAPPVGDTDELVRCPALIEPVSVALGCRRCVWRGAAERSCSYPVARGYLEELRRAGKALPGR